jgi:hypothetical protein
LNIFVSRPLSSAPSRPCCLHICDCQHNRMAQHVSRIAQNPGILRVCCCPICWARRHKVLVSPFSSPQCSGTAECIIIRGLRRLIRRAGLTQWELELCCSFAFDTVYALEAIYCAIFLLVLVQKRSGNCSLPRVQTERKSDIRARVL